MTEASVSPASARHRAREVALQALFAMDLQQRPQRPRRGDAASEQLSKDESHPDAPPPAVPPAVPTTAPATALEVFEGVAEHFEMPHAAHAFARELVVQVVEGCAGLDAIVSSHAKNWRVSRMAIVDRNILRLATFELAHTETPAPVVLNEAVELARRFGSDESPPFVNGVLDAVARQIRGEESR
jgi:N utilization substance protein B